MYVCMYVYEIKGIVFFINMTLQRDCEMNGKVIVLFFYTRCNIIPKKFSVDTQTVVGIIFSSIGLF